VKARTRITFGPLPPGIPANLTGCMTERRAVAWLLDVEPRNWPPLDEWGRSIADAAVDLLRAVEDAASLPAPNRTNPGDLCRTVGTRRLRTTGTAGASRRGACPPTGGSGGAGSERKEIHRYHWQSKSRWHFLSTSMIRTDFTRRLRSSSRCSRNAICAPGSGPLPVSN